MKRDNPKAIAARQRAEGQLAARLTREAANKAALDAIALSPDFSPELRAACLKGLWSRISGEWNTRSCSCAPDSMPPRAGNPEKLAKLAADADYNDPSFCYEE